MSYSFGLGLRDRSPELLNDLPVHLKPHRTTKHIRYQITQEVAKQLRTVRDDRKWLVTFSQVMQW